MRRIQKSAITIILGVVCAISADAKQWTLQECLDSTLTNRNHRLTAAKEQWRAAQAAEKEERANLYGSFDLGGNYLYNTEVQSVNIPITIPGKPSPTLTFGDHNTYDFTASAKYPLYMGGAQENRYHAAQEASKAAGYDERAERVTLAADVRRAYYNALGAQVAVAIAGNIELRATMHNKDVEYAVKAGTMSHEALIQSVITLDQATTGVRQAAFDLFSAMTNLRTITGLTNIDQLDSNDLSAGIKHDSTFIKDGVEYRNVEQTFPVERIRPKNQYTENPNYQALNQRVTAAKYLHTASTGSWYPSLAVQRVYHYARPGVNMTVDKWMNYSTVGLQASWSLFDWGARNAHIEKARSNAIVLDEKLNDLGRNIDAAMDIAEEHVITAEQIYISVSHQSILSKRRFEMVEERWKQGQATELEWHDAHNDLANAEQNVNVALVHYQLAKAEFLFTSGKESK